MIVLGCDQGYASFGYTVMEYTSRNHFTVLESGTLKTKADKPFEERISIIYEHIKELILQYQPDCLGLERLFFREKKNQESFRSATIIQTNMVSGVLFLLAHQHTLRIKELAPASVKKTITGNGRATKQEMLDVIGSYCQQQGVVLKTDHQADSMGIAISTGHFFSKQPQTENEGG